MVIFLYAVVSTCSKNPEDLCCRNGMGKKCGFKKVKK